MKEDVLNYIQRRDRGPPMHIETPPPTPAKPPVHAQTKAAPPPAQKPPPVVLKQDRTEPIKGYKKAMVKTMSAALVSSAYLFEVLWV